jgi:hypothetical protein
MTRYTVGAAGMTLLVPVLLFGTAAPAMAQGPLKPINALIVNDSSTPVPVTVVTPAAQTDVVCSWAINGSVGGTTFINGAGNGIGVSSFSCPAGVTKVAVQRVLFIAGSGATGNTSQNVASYRSTVTVRNQTTATTTYLAYLTEGAPEAGVIQPYVLDTTSTSETLSISHFATSGIPGVSLSLTGTILLTGHPVQ